jgi:hypothetical protein
MAKRKTKQERLDDLYDVIRVPRGGDTPQNHTKGFFDVVKDIKDKLGKDITIVEVGSYAGVSTEILALNFKNIIAVDAWLKALELGYAELNEKELQWAVDEFAKVKKRNKNIKTIEAFSSEAAEQIKDESIDCVYIDANHKYEFVKKDILAWRPKVKQGGIIAGHDYKNILGVRQAVNDVLGTPEKLYDDCSWLVNK